MEPSDTDDENIALVLALDIYHLILLLSVHIWELKLMVDFVGASEGAAVWSALQPATSGERPLL